MSTSILYDGNNKMYSVSEKFRNEKRNINNLSSWIMSEVSEVLFLPLKKSQAAKNLKIPDWNRQAERS